MLSYAALILNTTTLLLMSADDSWNGPDDPETGPSAEVAKTEHGTFTSAETTMMMKIVEAAYGITNRGGFSFLGVLGGRKGWRLKIRQRGPSLGNFE